MIWNIDQSKYMIFLTALKGKACANTLFVKTDFLPTFIRGKEWQRELISGLRI